jgi:hypothetical protein
MPRRAWSVVSFLALVFTAAGPAEPPAADHVLMLTATWSCRTESGALTRLGGARQGNEVEVSDAVRPPEGTPYTLHERYEYDGSAGVWHVRTGTGVRTDAPPWTGAVWELTGTTPKGTGEQTRFELLPGGDVRRTISQEYQYYGRYRPVFAERCSPGETPPPADACIVENFPAHALSLSRPNRREMPMNAPHGSVRIAVHLDEGSHVTEAHVISSDAATLNASALNAARTTLYQSEIRDCRPVATDYFFNFNN